MRNSGAPSFASPTTPPARVLHLLRPGKAVTRAALLESTGLSQPTITRAVTALIAAGLARERPDLVQRTRKRGRPTVPVEIADHHGSFAGIAVGTHSHYVALYDFRGRTLAATSIEKEVAATNPDDFLELLVAAVYRLRSEVPQPLLAVGMTTSGRVRGGGVVDATNLGWRGVEAGAKLQYHFPVPVTVTSAVSAILGAELHTTHLEDVERTTTLALFADDSLSAALSSREGAVQIHRLPTVRGNLLGATAQAPETLLSEGAFARVLDRCGVELDTPLHRAFLDERAELLGQLTGQLLTMYTPDRVVIAGSAFTQDAHRAPSIFARTARSTYASQAPLELRMIPTHQEIVRSIARAVALDTAFRDPLRFATPSTN